MTKAQKLSVGILGGVGALLALTDVVFLLDGEPSNTYSSLIAGSDWTAGGIGYLGAHLLQRTKPKREGVPGWISILAGAIAIGGGKLVGGGLLGGALGFALGLLFWGNSRQT